MFVHVLGPEKRSHGNPAHTARLLRFDGGFCFGEHVGPAVLQGGRRGGLQPIMSESLNPKSLHQSNTLNCNEFHIISYPLQASLLRIGRRVVEVARDGAGCGWEVVDRFPIRTCHDHLSCLSNLAVATPFAHSLP